MLTGTAMLPYVLTALFGAALWGDAAAATGNVLLNDVYGEGVTDPATGLTDFGCDATKQVRAALCCCCCCFGEGGDVLMCIAPSGPTHPHPNTHARTINPT